MNSFIGVAVVCVLLNVSLSEAFSINEDVRTTSQIEKSTNAKKSGRENSCGEGLTWSLVGDTLTISGSGEMTNYTQNDAPWCNNRGSIKNIVIEEGVTSIGNYAFYSCYKVPSVAIPSTVTIIGEHAFDACSQLSSILIPKNVKSVGSMAFYSCSALNSINVEQDNMFFKSIDGVLFDHDCSTIIQYPLGNANTFYTIPDGVISIGDAAFSSAWSLTRIHLPDSVTSIGNESFSSCYGLNNIDIPDNVESIGSNAFHFSSLTSISIPSKVSFIGDAAFSLCSQLTSIGVDDKNTHFKSIGGVLFNYELTSLIKYPAGNTSTSYAVPESVTLIGCYAFGDCSYLSTVTLPSSVTSIGEHAFESCKNLKHINIPKNVKSIEEYVFASCHSIDNITIPDGVTSIGDNAFCNCYALTSIVIPGSVKSIGKLVFSVCKLLRNVTISDGVTSIGSDAFWGCNNLTDITIPGSVESIGRAAFSHCESLSNVVIEDGVKTIEELAFFNCKQLTNIFIPDSVASIGERAFDSCISLESVNIPDSVTLIGSGAFRECTGLTSVYYEGSQAISSDVFYGCNSLKLICVSPDYPSSSTFGGMPVSSDGCEEFQSLFDHCFKATHENGTFIQHKRKNATEWEDGTNGCVEYLCDNISGRIARSLCYSTDSISRVCVDESRCVEEDKAIDKENYALVLDLDGIEIVAFNVSLFIDELTSLTGMNISAKSIAFNIDEDGLIIRILLILDDSDDANKVEAKINALDKAELSKYGFLRHVKRIHVLDSELNELESNILSCGYQSVIKRVPMLLMIVITFHQIIVS